MENKSVWKAAQHMPLGTSKLKQQDTILYLEWWKPKTLTISNADKNMEQQELSFTAGRNAKWYGHFHLEKSVALY